MREMKDSGVEWIGEIPVDWEILKGKYCYSVQAGYPFDSKKFSLERGFPLIRIRDITSGYTETFYDGDYDEAYVVHSGDCIIGMDGDFNIRVWNNDNALLNQRCCRIKTNEKTVVQWVFYNLPFELKVINDLAYSTTVKHLSNEDILNAYVIIPKLNEQNILVDYLNQKCSQIDSIISKQEAIIEKLKEYKLSIITEAVTKGLDPNVEMKDSGIEQLGYIPESWSVSELRYVCEMQAGKSLASEEIRDSGDYPVYGGNGIRGYYEKCNVAGKVILIGRQGALCGNVHLVDGQLWATEHAVITNPRCSINTDFLYFALIASNLNQYVSSTAAQPGLAVGTIKRVKISIPPIIEQEGIVDYIYCQTSGIDNQILLFESEVSKFTEYKKSLIYEAVTGKREV